jgi:hypothetical protein
MTLHALDSLPASSKLWIVGLTSPLADTQVESLEGSLSSLLATWTHKGQLYAPAYSILFKQVILIAEESMAHQASGCAIDGLMRKFGTIASHLSLKMINPAESILWTNDQRDYRVSAKSDIPALIQKDSLKPTSLIADFSLETLGELRTQGLFKVSATTWLGRKYFQTLAF